MGQEKLTKEMMANLRDEWVKAQRLAAAARAELDAKAQLYCVQEGAPLGSELDYTDLAIKVVQQAPAGPPGR